MQEQGILLHAPFYMERETHSTVRVALPNMDVNHGVWDLRGLNLLHIVCLDVLVQYLTQYLTPLLNSSSIERCRGTGQLLS